MIFINIWYKWLWLPFLYQLFLFLQNIQLDQQDLLDNCTAVCMGCDQNTIYMHWHTIWMAPWKNRISSTIMKLRKSLINPVIWQNISSCLVLPPEIVMHAHLMLFSERPPTYASLCMKISGGRTEHLDIIAGFLLRHWLYEWFSSTENVRQCVVHDDLGWKNRTTCCNRFLRAGYSRIRRHLFSILTNN